MWATDCLRMSIITRSQISQPEQGFWHQDEDGAYTFWELAEERRVLHPGPFRDV